MFGGSPISATGVEEVRNQVFRNVSPSEIPVQTSLKKDVQRLTECVFSECGLKQHIYLFLFVLKMTLA